MMKGLKKRILSFIICLALVLGMIPVDALQVQAATNVIERTIVAGENLEITAAELGAEVSPLDTVRYNWSIQKDGTDYTNAVIGEQTLTKSVNDLFVIFAVDGNCILDGATVTLTIAKQTGGTISVPNTVLIHATHTPVTTEDDNTWIPGEEQHYQKCEKCDTEYGHADHEPSDWIVDQEATEKAPGSQHRECIVCKKVVETAEIEQLACTHTVPRDTWSFSEKYHYHLCICGKSNMNAERHIAGDWILDPAPTPEEDGKRYKKCTVCEYKMVEETIAYEDSVISAISVSNVEIPQKDETIENVENTPTSLVYGGQYQLSSISFEVYNEETESWEGLGEEDVFVQNTGYRMKIWLAATTGYSFAATIANENITVNGEAATLAEITDDKQYACVYKAFRYDCAHSFTEKIEDADHYVEGSGNNCKSAIQYYYDCAYCDVISFVDIWTSDTYGYHHLDDNNYCEVCEKTIYEVWVGNTEIHSGNAEDVLGDGTVSYNPEANVLTLNGYVYEGKGYKFEEDSYAAIYSEGDLNLVIKGTNEIINTEGSEDYDLFGIMSFSGDVTIFGDGKLNVSSSILICANEGEAVINGGTLYLEGDTGIIGENVQINGGDTTIGTTDVCTLVYGEGNTLEVTGGNLCLRTNNLGAFVYHPIEEEMLAPDLSNYKNYVAQAYVPSAIHIRALAPRGWWEEFNPWNIENYAEIQMKQIPEEEAITSVEIDHLEMPIVGETQDDLTNAPWTLTYKGNYEMVELGWYYINESGDRESVDYDEPFSADLEYYVSLVLFTECEWGFPTDLKIENVTINGREVDEIENHREYDEDGGYLTIDMFFYPEMTDIEIEEIPDLIYTGKEQKPAVKVYHDDVLLKAGKDYTLTYVNNKNANAYEPALARMRRGRMTKVGDGIFGSMTEEGFNPDLPYVIIKGKGNYQKEVYVNFNILAPVIGDGSAEEADGVVLKYTDHTEANGKLFKPLTSMKFDKITMKSGVDYAVVVTTPDAPETNLLNSKGQMEAVEGTYIMTITGLGNFDGEIVKTISVAGKPQLLKNAKIKLNVKSKEFDYKDLEGDYTTLNDEDYTVTIKDGKVTKELIKDTDFTVSYRNNDKLGTATLVVTGKGSYVGTKTITFKITGTKLTAKNVEITNVEDMVYTGKAIEQKAKLVLTKADGTKVDLIVGEDYQVTYKNNLKKGTATITFTGNGKSGYTGSVKKTFKIKAAELTDSMLAPIGVVLYKKGGATDDGQIMLKHNGIRLIQGKDYTLKYADNKDIGEAKVTITGKGNFTGSLTRNFEVSKQFIENTTVTVKPLAYKAKEGYVYKLSVTVKDGKSTLKNGKDYVVEFTNPGKADLELWYAGDESKAPKAVIKAVEGSCYTGSVEVPVTIYNCKLSSSNAYVKVDAVETVYNGSQQLPNIEVYYSADKAVIKELKAAEKTGTVDAVIAEKLAAGKITKLDQETDYTVSGGKNIFAGLNKGVVKATGTGTYSGSVSAKFTIQSKDLWWYE